MAIPLSVMEIQSQMGNTQCGRLRRIVRRFTSAMTNSQDAATDLSQAFEEALDNAPLSGNGSISLRVFSNTDNSISLEMAYPDADRREHQERKKCVFEKLFLTEFPDSLEYTINGDRVMIRMTKCILLP
jgi:hypothetical protein